MSFPIKDGWVPIDLLPHPCTYSGVRMCRYQLVCADGVGGACLPLGVVDGSS